MPGTILVAEDDSSATASIHRAFTKLGLTNPLQFVSDGQAATEYLRGEGPYHDRKRFGFPELILLNLHLPKAAGFRFLEWLRAQADLRHLPVIALTSSVFSPDVTRAYRLGANSFLTKPLDLPEHLGAVREMAEFWLARSKIARVRGS